MATSFFGGAFFNGEFFNTVVPPSIDGHDGGARKHRPERDNHRQITKQRRKDLERAWNSVFHSHNPAIVAAAYEIAGEDSLRDLSSEKAIQLESLYQRMLDDDDEDVFLLLN